MRLTRLLMTLSLLCLSVGPTLAAPGDYFKITVVDDVTGRGIPLVELKTTNSIRYYTDSNGVVAVNEPGLFGQSVYFSLKSHGYEHPADGFGNRGEALNVTPGGSAVLKMKRLNVAERLYRMTGEGIYRDSILTGQAVPTAHPLLDGEVMGQDTVEVIPYHGKIYWFWGDTDRPAYPLGNFATTGATSELPGKGGLDPDRGVNLNYFTDKDGFVKKMIPLNGPGPVWVGGLITVQDKGVERLLTHYTRIKNLGEAYEQGLAVFNDQASTFERLTQFDLKAPLVLDGHPFHALMGGQDYLVWGGPYPLARAVPDMAHITDPKTYEAYTCLVAGSRYDKNNPQLDRAPDGHLIYGWKADTPFLNPGQQQELIAAGKMKPEEALLQLRDIETGKLVQAHSGSVFWNTYRNRWVMIGEQTNGTSLLGELWFAEADTPLGPWVYARKIVTHDKYTFYNVTQHPYFDQDGGRRIYFEGTYTDFLTGNPDITPRYNYNQIMYRLNLDDARLALPVPIYQSPPAPFYIQGDALPKTPGRTAAFFALPPGGKHEGFIPIYAGNNAATAPLFYALPAEAKPDASADLVPLYMYHRADGSWLYDTDANLASATVKRDAQPICRVWRNPMPSLNFDYGTRPVAQR